MPSQICDQARLVEVKNVSADVSERQALSNLIRCSSSCEPIVKYDSLSTLMSRVNVDARRAGLEHCRNVPLFPLISDWERSENRLNRLLSCVGMSKILEWFLLFLATMASIHAEDRRLAKDGGEVRIEAVYALLRAMRAALRCGLWMARSFKEPGKTGSQWRIPYSLQLPSLTCDFFEVTATFGQGNGESLNRVPAAPQEPILADAGYCCIRILRGALHDLTVRHEPPN
jgi:hypothetical protein